MGEKLLIKNFGPINDMSFDFNKINILIGDQGTGKSTVAKILCAIKNCIFREIFDLPDINNLDKNTQQFYAHLNLVGIESFLKRESFLFYRCLAFQFELKDNKVSIHKNISIQDSLYYNFNYIPAERNMVHVLADSLYALLELKTELPKLFTRFGNKYQTSRKSKSEFNYSEILGVKFTHRDNKDYILIPDGSEINLSDASSGIQGCIALLAVLDNIMSESSPSGRSQTLTHAKTSKLLVIEEPELSCFPQTQYKLIKYIIENNKISRMEPIVVESEDQEDPTIDLVESHDNYLLKNQLIITTHSPYVLTSLNNLMYSYEVGQKHGDEVDKIVNKKYWTNSDDVSAYRLLPNGICESILDRKEKLIMAEKIDEVSGFLNEQFDALLNIELVKQ